MLYVNQDFNPLLKKFRLVYKNDNLLESLSIAKQLHAFVHDKSLGLLDETFQNQVLKHANEEIIRNGKSKKYEGKRTPAFLIYHMTRIEDICANTLIMNQPQVLFEQNWDRAFYGYLDTGNSWSKEKIDAFSQMIDINKLFAYRAEVAAKTQKILGGLTQKMLREKPSLNELQKVIESGSLTQDESSIWLIDFWGNKNKAELIMMPLTRHQVVHLNDCDTIIQSRLKSIGTPV